VGKDEEHVTGQPLVEDDLYDDPDGDDDQSQPEKERQRTGPRCSGSAGRHTKITTAAIIASKSGLVVLIAVTAIPAAQIHHASGCRDR